MPYYVLTNVLGEFSIQEKIGNVQSANRDSTESVVQQYVTGVIEPPRFANNGVIICQYVSNKGAPFHHFGITRDLPAPVCHYRATKKEEHEEAST